MDDNKSRKSLFSKKVFVVVLPLLMILAIVVGVAVFSEEEREVVFKDFGYAISNTSRFISVMKVPGDEADISDNICVLTPDHSIKISDGKVKYEGETVSSQLPMFFDDSTYIYIPWEKAVFLGSDLYMKSFEGNAFLIREGFFGDDYTIRDSGRDLLLLSCTKNLFLALKEFSITSRGMKLAIKPMSFVLFDGYSVRTAFVSENTAYREYNGIGKDSLVTIDGCDYIMEDFLSVLGLSVERDSAESELEGIEVPDGTDVPEPPKSIDDIKQVITEETFRYFLGNRYDYPENLEVYKYNGFWYEKRDNFVSEMDGSPMYGEEYIWLPDDYGLADVYGGKVFYLPAFSRIERIKDSDGNTFAVSTDGKTRIKLPKKSFLFDGYENYVFTDETELLWNNETITLPALSYINYDGAGRLGVYSSEEGVFYEYSVKVDSIKVMYPEKYGVDIVKRMMIRDGEESPVIVDQPEFFDSYFETH
ncbi:MAG: hypothetical protein K5655_10240 [Lachnospiraceae bacterium]|nr:hypothetical protein [Lachnospiraceae bacterium]